MKKVSRFILAFGILIIISAADISRSYGAWVYSNNGLSYQWHDPSENYQPQAGEQAFAAQQTPAQLASEFSGYAAAATLSNAAQTGATAYQAALVAGVPISCASGATVCAASVAATYPLVGQPYDDLKDAVLWTKAYGAFPNGASSLTFVLAPTVTVTFTSPTQLEAVGVSLAAYVTALKQAYAASQLGGPWSPPAMPAPLD